MLDFAVTVPTNILISIPMLEFYVFLIALYLDVNHLSSSLQCVTKTVSKWHVKHEKESAFMHEARSFHRLRQLSFQDNKTMCLHTVTWEDKKYLFTLDSVVLGKDMPEQVCQRPCS